jgi:hypothetical protein
VRLAGDLPESLIDRLEEGVEHLIALGQGEGTPVLELAGDGGWGQEGKHMGDAVGTKLLQHTLEVSSEAQLGWKDLQAKAYYGHPPAPKIQL